MKFIKFFILIFICSVAFAKKIDVRVDQKEVVLGQNFILQIKFEHSGNEEPYVSFDPKNAEVIDDNSQDNSRVQIQGYFAGGKIVQKKVYVYRYTLQPVKSGYVHIRNIKVDLGANVLRHKSMQVKVLSKAKRLPDYIFRAETDKTTAYVGESINLNYYLYFRGNIAAQPDIRKFPKLKNFLKRFELPKGGVERVSLQGKVFQRILLYRAIVYPQKEGKLSIDPMSISFQYPDRVARNRDVFGMTFSTGRYKTKKMNSKRVKLEVLPIPTEGMPTHFTGLVGNHEFNLSFVRTKVLVNDILEARLEVTGEGALETLDPPKIINNENFEEFEAKTEIVELGSLANKKVIDYTFLGKRSSKVEARTIKLSYFDPTSRQFVEKELEIPALQIFGAGVSSEVLEKDIKKDSVGTNDTSEKKGPEIELVGPIFKIQSKDRVFNLRNINIGLFALIIIILLSGFKLSLGRTVSSNLSLVKKDLNYKNIHNFLIESCDKGDTLRDKLELADISSEARAYFADLLDKAEKNEYKGKNFKLEFKKKYFLEMMES
jgi:hypothetical protein